MSVRNKQTFNQSLPTGWTTLTQTFAVAGSNLRSVTPALKVHDINSNIYIEPEPDNEYDTNALKIMINKQGLIFSKQFHIGYIPAELAQAVCKHRLQDKISIIVVSVISYDNGNKAVICQIIGQDKHITERIRKSLNDF